MYPYNSDTSSIFGSNPPKNVLIPPKTTRLLRLTLGRSQGPVQRRPADGAALSFFQVPAAATPGRLGALCRGDFFKPLRTGKWMENIWNIDRKYGKYIGNLSISPFNMTILPTLWFLEHS